jgi:hypothetical protein
MKSAAQSCAALASLCLMSAQTLAESPDVFTIEGPHGYSVAGEIHFPDTGNGPVPAVILVSGSGPQDRHAELGALGYSAHRQWNERLTSAGFAVITFDETGTGQTGGTWSEMGLEEHRDNVAAIIRSARADDRIEASQIYALGHSEGGMIISMLSAIDPDLAGLVYAAAPGTPLSEVIAYQVEEMAHARTTDPDEFETVRAQVEADFMAMLDSAASLRDGLLFNPLDLAREVRAPALVIQGESDWQVRVEQAYALSAALEASGQPVELAVFSDVNHLLVNDPDHNEDYANLTRFDLDPRLTARVAAWLQRQAGLTRTGQARSEQD